MIELQRIFFRVQKGQHIWAIEVRNVEGNIVDVQMLSLHMCYLASPDSHNATLLLHVLRSICMISVEI